MRSQIRLRNRQIFTVPQIFPKAAILQREAADHADALSELTSRHDSIGQWLARPVSSGENLSGAAMNAILNFPAHLAAEFQQLRCEIACHRSEIEVAATAHEQSLAVWCSNETDISRRMSGLRERLARLLA